MSGLLFDVGQQENPSLHGVRCQGVHCQCIDAPSGATRFRNSAASLGKGGFRKSATSLGQGGVPALVEPLFGYKTFPGSCDAASRDRHRIVVRVARRDKLTSRRSSCKEELAHAFVGLIGMVGLASKETEGCICASKVTSATIGFPKRRVFPSLFFVEHSHRMNAREAMPAGLEN